MDVLLFQSVDGGNISVVDGITEMTGGFETMAYLCLFGGNEDDNGLPGNRLTWWGNLLETNPAFKYVSETQHLLRSIPAISANLLRIEEAAKRDLQVFLDLSIASSVELTVTIPALNSINISGIIFAEGEEISFSFTENWRSLTK